MENCDFGRLASHFHAFIVLSCMLLAIRFAHIDAQSSSESSSVSELPVVFSPTDNSDGSVLFSEVSYNVESDFNYETGDTEFIKIM